VQSSSHSNNPVQNIQTLGWNSQDLPVIRLRRLRSFFFFDMVTVTITYAEHLRSTIDRNENTIRLTDFYFPRSTTHDPGQCYSTRLYLTG